MTLQQCKAFGEAAQPGPTRIQHAVEAWSSGAHGSTIWMQPGLKWMYACLELACMLFG